MPKEQLHNRFTDDQVKIILQWYLDKSLVLNDALERLECKEAQFYRLLKAYRNNPDKFTIAYSRHSPQHRLSANTDKVIKQELAKDRQLIENKEIPIRSYNYSAVRDAVASRIKHNISSQTIRNRAKKWGYAIPKRLKKKTHDREVITTAAGILLQHDSSSHLFSPLIEDKWSLITTIDDYSRYLLYGAMTEEETAWTHIQAAQSVVLKYGVGLAYYTDSFSIFRFVSHQKSIWSHQIKGTDDVMTQWKRVIEDGCGMKSWYALSPQAKGKIERPYRWLQDRIVRKCAKEGIKTISEARVVLQDEINRYNQYQVHSTTKEIPAIRFQKAIDQGKTVFKPFKLKPPYTSVKDIFCLKEVRIVGPYRKISWDRSTIDIPGYVPIGSAINLHVIPDDKFPEVRLWFKDKLIKVVRLKSP